MHFLLTLSTDSSRQQLPVNYQYPLSAVIYKILQRADSEYADFLHNSGYKKEGSLKTFKLFSFSDIKTPFQNTGDRLLLLTRYAELVVSFHLPQAAENFIKGIFQHQQIEIADKKSRVVFMIDQVSALPLPLAAGEMQEVLLQPLSPVVAGNKNEKNEYTFLSPEHPDFVRRLMYNWKEKYAAIYGDQEADNNFAAIQMNIIFYSNPPKSRLITIKAFTAAETKIRGYVNFRLKIHAGKKALELLLNAGAGVYNSLGMGCMEVVV
jgi:CRISPR-associated endoribonuclease Cas6